MPILNIEGRKIRVDDSFSSLSTEQKNATVEEIVRAMKIVPKTPELAKPDESKGTYRGTILPMERNLDTGERSWAMPTMLQGILDSGAAAVTAPGRAMAGDLPMTDEKGNTSPQAIAEGFNLASWVSPTSIASGTGKEIAKNAGVTTANDALESVSARLMRKTTPEMADKALNSERNQLLQASGRLGVDMPRAAISESSSVQNIGKKLSELPIVGTPIKTASRNAMNQLDDAATATQTSLGTGDMAVAGNKISRSISDFAKIEEPANVSALYGELKKVVNPDVTTPLSATAKIASELTARDARQRIGANRAADFVADAVQSPMAYEDIKGLRTRVGNMLADPLRKELSNLKVSEEDMNALYAALSTDLKNSVKAAGGDEGLKLFNEANNRAAIFARDKAAIKKVMGTGSDENIASNLIAMAGNTGRANVKDLMLMKSKVSKDSWNELSSAAISRLSGGDADFSPAKFTTAWNKMSPTGKKILFDEQSRKALNDIALVSGRFQKLQQYANPSQSGAMALTGAGATGLIAGLFEPTTLAVTATTALTGRGLSWYLSKPARVKVLADYSKAYEMAARAPGKSSTAFLGRKAQELALIVANDVGKPGMAGSLAAKLMLQKQAAADQNDNVGVGEDVGQQQPRTESQMFNDAYLQGNAL